MNEMIGNWEDLRLFIAVAREGGLSPAARLTGSSAATLGRRMLVLERKMGRELFIRHERGYEITEAARELLNDLTKIEALILRLSPSSKDTETPLVKVSAGTWTTMVLLENLDAITGVPTDIRLRFISDENILDIQRREVVIGFRNERPKEHGLAGRKLARVEFAPYSSDDTPKRWIKVIADTPSARWLDKKVGSDILCEVNAPRNSLDLALAGNGIALLPTFIGDTQKGLKRIGGTISELTHDQWIVTHQDDRHLPEVRRTIDRMCIVLMAGK